MDIRRQYPKKWATAEVTAEGPVMVTIVSVDLVKVGQDTIPSPVLAFEEISPRLRLNKSNAKSLIEIFGTAETDRWIGGRVELYSIDTEYQGQPVKGLRIRKAGLVPTQEDDSEIPF